MSVCLSRLIVKSHDLGVDAESKEPINTRGSECVGSSIPFFLQNNKVLLFMKKANKTHFNFTIYYELKSLNTV